MIINKKKNWENRIKKMFVKLLIEYNKDQIINRCRIEQEPDSKPAYQGF